MKQAPHITHLTMSDGTRLELRADDPPLLNEDTNTMARTRPAPRPRRTWARQPEAGEARLGDLVLSGHSSGVSVHGRKILCQDGWKMLPAGACVVGSSIDWGREETLGWPCCNGDTRLRGDGLLSVYDEQSQAWMTTTSQGVPPEPEPQSTATAEELALPLGFRFQPPFAAAPDDATTCWCVVCGTIYIADQRIGTYPHKFIPKGWSVGSRHGETRCPAHDNDVAYTFWLEHDVFRSTGAAAAWRVQRRTFAPLTTNPWAYAPITTNPTQPPEKTMTTNRVQSANYATPAIAAKEILTREATLLGGAALLGGQLAAVDQAGETLLDIFKVVTSRAPALAVLLETAEGRELAKLVVAASLHAMAVNTELFPAADTIAHITELQVTVSTYKLITPQLAELRTLVEKLSGFGAALAPATSPATGL